MANIQEMHDQAGADYLASVMEFRRTRAVLAAYDLLRGNHSGFGGTQPDVVSMRHSTYASELSGSLQDDAAAMVAEINKSAPVA